MFVLHSEYFPVLIAHAFNHWAVRAVPKVRKAAASIGVGFIRRLATKDPLNGEFLYLTWRYLEYILGYKTQLTISQTFHGTLWDFLYVSIEVLVA